MKLAQNEYRNQQNEYRKSSRPFKMLFLVIELASSCSVKGRVGDLVWIFFESLFTYAITKLSGLNLLKCIYIDCGKRRTITASIRGLR